MRIYGYNECPPGYSKDPMNPGCCEPDYIVPPGGGCPPDDVPFLAATPSNPMPSNCPPGWTPDPNAAYCCKHYCPPGDVGANAVTGLCMPGYTEDPAHPGCCMPSKGMSA